MLVLIGLLLTVVATRKGDAFHRKHAGRAAYGWALLAAAGFLMTAWPLLVTLR